MADGSLIFDTKIDTTGFDEGEQDIKSKAKKASEAMESAGKELEDAIKSATESVGGLGEQAEETAAKIQAVLDDTSRSAKSKAASIAAVYREQGMDASEAMKTAWEHIERGSADIGEGIRQESEKSSQKIKDDAESSALCAESAYQRMGSSISRIFKKAALTIAAAFSVTKLVQFGKEATNLASDVQEVQNVVDTAFGSMSYKMEAFADTCIETYGMSKLTAKEMGSTFMAMARGIGQASDIASDKAVELTGRLGDIMSFYNKEASEVNTIGKAIYSGEAEPLKQIGIIMTETNLKTYALSKGYKKLYTEMSAAEKLLVRQEYFLEQTEMAAGDFVKTQDSWANQTRILSERWKEFMTICGNALIEVLTPTVKVLNNLVSSMIDIGRALSDVFGISVSSAITEEAAAARKEVEGLGDSIEEAAKQAGGTASFDNLVIIGKEDGGGDGSIETGTEARKEETAAVQESEKATSALEETLKSLGDTIGWLGTVFETSFLSTFGNTGVFDGIVLSVQGIKESLLGTLSDSGVQEAATGFVEAYVGSLGSSAGAFVSAGSSIADNLTGGISLSLEQNGGNVQDSIIALFDIGERMAEVQEGFSEAVSYICTAFQSDEAKQVTADIITIFTNAVLGVTELLGGFGVDVVGLITAPFVDNEDLIKTTIEDTLKVVSPALDDLKETVTLTFGTLRGVYDEKIAPMIESFQDGFGEIGEKLLLVYNEYILPVIGYLREKFGDFTSGPLQELIEKFGEFAGKVSECVTTIWEEYLKPFILWFIEEIAPKIQEGLETAIDAFSGFWESVSETLGFLLDALGGLIDAATGVLTGDWEKFWGGLVGFVKGMFNTMVRVIKTAMSTIKSGIATVLNAIRSKFVSVFQGIKGIVSSIFGGLWDNISGVINKILGGIEWMANGVVRGINKVIGALNNLSFDIPDWIPGIGGETFGFSIPTLSEVSIPRLATGTVVPANFGEFAAILGDNKREAEVVSPLSTMKRAFKEAIAEMGGLGGGEYTFVAQLDGQEIFREVVRQNRMYKKQTGKTAFQ